MLFGNLTRDPEMRAMPSGGNVTSFSVATNRVYKKADGTRAEQTDYHNVVVFGRQAETSAQYLKKGSSVYIEGRLQTRSWDKEGVKQYRTEVIADRVQFGPRPASAGGAPVAAHEDFGGTGDTDAHAPQSSKSDVGIDYPAEDINPDDIPF